MSLLEDLRAGTFEESVKFEATARFYEGLAWAGKVVHGAESLVGQLRTEHPVIDRSLSSGINQVRQLSVAEIRERAQFVATVGYHGGILAAANVVAGAETLVSTVQRNFPQVEQGE